MSSTGISIGKSTNIIAINDTVANRTYIDNRSERFIDIRKISSLIKILCDNDSDKIKKVIEADIDLEISTSLVSLELGTDFLIKLFKSLIEKENIHSYIELILKTIDNFSTKKDIIELEVILKDSKLIEKSPTVYFTIEKYLKNIKNNIPNSVSYIMED